MHKIIVKLLMIKKTKTIEIIYYLQKNIFSEGNL